MEQNRLTWQMGLQQGIADVYSFDNTIFDNFIVDESIDRTLCIDSIMLKYGMTPLFRTDPKWLKYFIGSWSRKNAITWKRLHDTMTIEYDPIENYNRYEEETSTHEASAAGTESMTGATVEKVAQDTGSTGKQSTDSTTESTHEVRTNTSGNNVHTVSADNVSTYQPDSQDSSTEGINEDGSNMDTLDTTVTDTRSEKIDRSSDSTAKEDHSRESSEESTDERSLHTHGNIGVTTSQQMLESERELVKFNIYDYIADSFHSEFCLYLY